MFNREELQEVKGIGPKTADNIMKFINDTDTENIYRLKEVNKVGEYLLNNIIARFDIMEMELDFLEVKEFTEKVKEVHLVGDMNDWQPANKDYDFLQDGNSYLGAFRLKAGTEYKVMYNSSDWSENKYFGDEDDSNFVVQY